MCAASGKCVAAKDAYKGNKYVCVDEACQQPKLVLRKGAKKVAHFAHWRTGEGVCAAKGEGQQHRLAKHAIADNLFAFTFKVKKCDQHCTGEQRVCFDAAIHVAKVEHAWRGYKLDVAVCDTQGQVVAAIEVRRSHAVQAKKAACLNAHLPIPMLEVDANDVMRAGLTGDMVLTTLPDKWRACCAAPLKLILQYRLQIGTGGRVDGMTLQCMLQRRGGARAGIGALHTFDNAKYDFWVNVVMPLGQLVHDMCTEYAVTQCVWEAAHQDTHSALLREFNSKGTCNLCAKDDLPDMSEDDCLSDDTQPTAAVGDDLPDMSEDDFLSDDDCLSDDTQPHQDGSIRCRDKCEYCPTCDFVMCQECVDTGMQGQCPNWTECSKRGQIKLLENTGVHLKDADGRTFRFALVGQRNRLLTEAQAQLLAEQRHASRPKCHYFEVCGCRSYGDKDAEGRPICGEACSGSDKCMQCGVRMAICTASEEGEMCDGSHTHPTRQQCGQVVHDHSGPNQDVRWLCTQCAVACRVCARPTSPDWGHKCLRCNLDKLRRADCLKSSKSLKRVAQEHPETYVKFHKGLQALQQALIEPRNQQPTVTVLVGPTGSGKSRKARELCDNPWIWTPSREKWFDGYSGQTDVIFEEFRGQLPFGMLLSLLDRYDCPVQYKGGSTEFAATNIIITSPKRPEYWYADNGNDKIDQLMRRLTSIEELQV